MIIPFLFSALIACSKSGSNTDDNGTPPLPPPPVNKDTLIIPTEGYDAPTSYEGYSLVWSDEFDGTSLSQTDWTFENGDGCPSLCGWGNNELQYYSSSADNLFFKEGKLVICAKKEAYGGKQYTSAKIKTQHKKPFRFGRIDIRAVMPVGQGIWPALWMMPDKDVHGTWPRSGEIDIMEYLGHDSSRVHGTVHYGPGPGSIQISRNTKLGTGSFNQKFHVFSLIWEEDKIQWLVDDVVFSTVTKADVGEHNYPFNEEFYFIMNLAVGGNWPGNPDNTTKFPQYFVVDYVRVYQ